MKLMDYWPWYRQRVSRTWHGRILHPPHWIRHMDSQYAFYCGPDRMFRPKWCEYFVDPHMLTHVPHEVIVPNMPASHRFDASIQETWCAQHVGQRDRDWLYVGKHTWRFRLCEDATQFKLIWS